MAVRRTRWLLVAVLAIAGLLLAPTMRGVPAARADYGKAIYQIAISQNCDNPAVCGAFLGGFWGWRAPATNRRILPPG
jgi:hypothetical protein